MGGDFDVWVSLRWCIGHICGKNRRAVPQGKTQISNKWVFHSKARGGGGFNCGKKFWAKKIRGFGFFVFFSFYVTGHRDGSPTRKMAPKTCFLGPNVCEQCGLPWLVFFFKKVIAKCYQQEPKALKMPNIQHCVPFVP